LIILILNLTLLTTWATLSILISIDPVLAFTIAAADPICIAEKFRKPLLILEFTPAARLLEWVGGKLPQIMSHQLLI